MASARTALVAAGLIAVAAVLAAPSWAGDVRGRYKLAADGGGAWRLDTVTGRMIWCETVARAPTAPITPPGAPAPAAGAGAPPTVIYGDTSRRRIECFDKDGRLDEALF